ncbi:MAG: hypothetical protein ACTSU9_09390 [Promethearchaeota archaeon]
MKGRNIFYLESRKSRIAYFFLSLIIVLSLRMLENTVHELSHGVAVLAVGGTLPENPFLITPFGGYTRWQDVPESGLPLVNIAGTLVSTIFMVVLFVPSYVRAKNRKLTRMIGYWGGVVIPVNSVFYWFMSPLIGTGSNYDPIGFALSTGIEPTWIIGVISALPFAITVYCMIRGTRTVNATILDDKKKFHAKCLVFYYIVSMAFPVVSYLNLLDAFKWW